MTHPKADPDPRPQIAAARRELRRKLLVRLIASIFVAMVVGAALAAKPGRVRLGLHAQLPGRDLVAVTYRYGWPEGIAHFTELVWRQTDGRTAPFDPQEAPPELSAGPLAIITTYAGWHVYWRAAGVLYLVCLAVVFVLLAARPVVIYRATKRRLAAALCPRCGYPTFGLPQPRCPECGEQVPL